MQTVELPQDVILFITEQIDTVPHLEALLLLFEQPAEQWTVERAAARLYVSVDAAAQILQDLERRKLVRKRLDEPASEYVYDPTWDGTGQLMASVAMNYRRYLAPVAAIIHAKASRSVREFARAFEFKKDR